MRSVTGRLYRVFLLILATAALFEAVTWAAVEAGWLTTRHPKYGSTAYWEGADPRFGVWRASDSEFEHRASCFSAVYRTNSIGARDIDRSPSAEGSRVVVLGDSLLEGWGLAAEDRLSNRLESATGIEHLNFAMAHFGPYQEVLVYRELAKKFQHDAVILGVLPANDFEDLDLEFARSHATYEHRYRPYLVGESPTYERFDYAEPLLRRLLRNYSYGFNAVLSARSRSTKSTAPVQPGTGTDPAALAPSWFYDFSEADARRLEAVLEMLVAEAGDRHVSVLLMPYLADLRRHAISGADPLSRRLAKQAERDGFTLVNLLPEMASHRQSWRRFFFPCDYHWTAEANQIALEIVLSHLEFYSAD